MSKQVVEASQMQCLIVNAHLTIGDELSLVLNHAGIACRAGNLDQIDANIPDFLVWIIEDESQLSGGFAQIAKLQLQQTKILVISHETIPLKQIEALASITQDVRLIILKDVYNAASLDSKSTINEVVEVLRQGQLPDISKLNFHPLKAANAADAILSVWFDRGHRGKGVRIQGSQIGGQSVVEALTKASPHLNKTSPISDRVGEIASVETKEVSQNTNDFIDYLIKQVPTANRAPFQAVVIEEDARPTFKAEVIPEPELAAPKPVPAPTRLNAAQFPESPKVVKKIVVPPSPQRTVTKQKKSIKFPTRWLWACVAISIVVSAMILSPAVILYAQAYQAKKMSLSATVDQIKRAESGLDWSHSNLASYINWMPEAIAKPIEAHFSTQLTQAKKSILNLKIAQNVATSAKLMVTAAEGDPFQPLQQAKHALDELYVMESTGESQSKENNHQLQNARQFISLLPHLIPQDKKVTLLVLLQNNLELRPTGGFIGAVALLSFDHGKLLNIETRDIYDLDANLKGVVTPPAELRTYLGESAWFFRDANWQINFKDSAATANWFLEKEWGSAADAVIGININTLKEVLTAIGPITLPDGQVMTAENLMVSAYNHQDVPTVKASAKKQEFLSLFIKPLFDKIGQSDAGQVVSILTALGKAAEHGELTIVSTDSIAQSSLSDLGWTGEYYAPACPLIAQESCSKDSLFINEANVGINKSNFYIERAHAHNVELSTTSGLHTHTLSLTNKSPNDTWPAGPYKSYIRLAVPENVSDITIVVDGQPVAKDQIGQISQTSRRVFNHFVEVKPQTTVNIMYTYTTPLPAASSTYVWGMQKQPGTTPDPLKLNVTSRDRSLTVSGSNFTASQGTAFSGNLDKNTYAAIELR